ncbi:hypothetical protein [Gulosibacter sp. 10]|uniref:hypothetical protein n=1 Tax=Gulosibacter sp. 10 TaxID=1255570 RepID=UPI00097EC765|nr:hypothetical protein [Gulosibacter sp. 10]SJM71552.1 hypothetical protein FM112_16475 [Gulosibacter sp. 10]
MDRLSDLEHARVLFEPRPLTPEEVEEFILIARSWAPQAVEADVVMDLPLDEMRRRFGQWSQGATAEGDSRTRWPIGGADWREALYGMLYIPPGVEYATDFPEPARASLREALERALRALEAEPPA